MSKIQTEPGLRERKKQRTRELIAQTAHRLFAERGFEAVTVAEIAREAEVAPATVFNYFPAKEDLFYGRLEELEEALAAAIRDRPARQGVLDAFATFLLTRQGALADDDPQADERLRTMTRVITDSPALLARERQVFDAAARALARVLAEDAGTPPGDTVCRTVANALVGLHRALIDHVREQTLADVPTARIRDHMRRQAERALAQLAHGLGDFGTTRPAHDAGQTTKREPLMTTTEIDQLLTTWTDAERTGNAATLDQLLTDDFVGIGPVGFMLDKPAWVGRFAQGLVYESLELDEILVRSHGDGAVVVAHQHAVGTHGNNPTPPDTRVSLTVTTAEGRPRIAAIQHSFIGPPLAPPR